MAINGFYTNTFSDRDIANNSIGNDTEAKMSRKLLSMNSQESYTMNDRNPVNTNKSFLLNSAGKVSSNLDSKTVKSQQKSQFFGQRRTKTTKYKNEFIRNQKHLQANGQTLSKAMKLSQAVDDHKSETRKYGYNIINSDQISSNKYGDMAGYNKLTNAAFRGIITQKDWDIDSRMDLSASKTGDTRTNTSKGPRWIESITRSYSKNKDTRKAVNSKMDIVDPKGISMKANKNIINEINDRRRSCEKIITDNDFMQGVEDNHRALKARYGDTSNFDNNKGANTSLLNQTRNNFTTQTLIENEQKSLANAKSSQNHKTSASASKLQAEDKDVRREDRFVVSKLAQNISKRVVLRDKDFRATMSYKRSFLTQVNPKLETPETKIQSINSSGSKECKLFILYLYSNYYNFKNFINKCN
jgi:hypothetical protein